MSEIYNLTVTDRLLGCIALDPTLLLSNKYRLLKEEFEPCLFHKVIFVCMYNLAVQGYKTVSILDLEAFLENYPPQYEVWKQNRGQEYLSTIMELVDVDNYESYWNEFKKLSCLNKYNALGFPIDKFWSFENTTQTNMENLNEYSLEDILNYFEGIMVSVKKEYSTRTVKEEYQAGTDFLEYKEMFKEEPLIGKSFQSPKLNAMFRGIYGFIIRVAKSGGGKSILSMGDLLKSTVKEYYDVNQGRFVKNKSRAGAGLFINTELELREELDPMIIAWISAVPRSHIINGKYEDGEEERVEYAAKILLESELYIVDDPEFTTKSLVDTIKDYTYNKNVVTVCFDYIQNNAVVAKQLAQDAGIPMREDIVLLQLTDRLKQVQRECGVSLISSVQTNGKEDELEVPTEAVLAGGKSQVRKTDGTLCMLPPTKKELQQLDVAIEKWNKEHNKQAFGGKIIPNNVIHLIKGRSSIYSKNTKIFQYVDLGTGRSIDMFATDRFNNPIKIEDLIIEYNNEGSEKE